MRCEHAQQNLKAFLDRELAWGERTQVRLHLARCPACRAELEAIKMAAHQVGSLPTPEQDSAVREAVLGVAREQRPSQMQDAGRRVRSWVVAAAGAAVIVGLALFLALRPTPAQAALDRVVAASKQVKSCHMKMVVNQVNAVFIEVSESWYQDGKWRLESSRNSTLVGVQVYDGKKSHHYVVEKNTVYLNSSDQPFGTEFRGFTAEALLKGAGEAEVERDTAPDTRGRTMNRFTITKSGRERMVLLADPETDLPTSFTVEAWVGSAWQPVGGSEVIEYNQPIDPKQFVLTYPANATVIDKATGAEAFWGRYDRGLDRATSAGKECVLRDLQVTSTGDAYAIWTWTGWAANSIGWADVTKVRPKDISMKEVMLEDSLGMKYVRSRGTDFIAGKWGDGYEWFIAPQPPAKRPEWYRLTLTASFWKAGPGEGAYDVAVSFVVRNPVVSSDRVPVYPKGTARGSGLAKQGETQFWTPRPETRENLLAAYAEEPANYHFAPH